MTNSSPLQKKIFDFIRLRAKVRGLFFIKKRQERRIVPVFCVAQKLESSLCLLAESGESSGIMDSGLGEHLAVHVDTGELEAVHEGGVVHAVCLGGGADTGDPQLTEVSLLQLAADVSVAAGLHDSLLGHLEVLGLGAPVALSQAQDLISSLARHHRAFNSSHV